jgi:hypothetical protein
MAILGTILTNIATGVIFITLFIFLRHHYKAFYQWKSYQKTIWAPPPSDGMNDIVESDSSQLKLRE